MPGINSASALFYRTRTDRELWRTYAVHVQAHRVVLGAYSEALASVLATYSSGEVIRLDLADFQSEAVVTVLHFLYTTELHLDCSTVGQVRSSYFTSTASEHLTVESYTVIICQHSYLLLFGIPSPTHSLIPGLKHVHTHV